MAWGLALGIHDGDADGRVLLTTVSVKPYVTPLDTAPVGSNQEDFITTLVRTTTSFTVSNI